MNQGDSRPSDQRPGEGLAIATLVIGIIAISIFILNWFVPFAEVALGILGIVLGIMSSGRGYKGGKLTAGMILSILSVALGGVYWVVCSLMCSYMFS